jgi:recombination protein RecA
MGRHKKGQVSLEKVVVPKEILESPEYKKEVEKIKTILSKEQIVKREKLHKIMSEINREFGEVVLKLAKDEPDKDCLLFGIKKVDELTGGGIAGNFIIIWGGESTGKSTLCLNQIAEAQKRGKICVYLDLEHSFSKERALTFGINLEELILIENANTAEEAMDIVLKLAKEKVADLIIIDSIQAMTPMAENESKKGKERSMSEDEIALLAKKMGKFLRRTGTPIYKAKIGITLVGQSRTGGIGGFATHEELTGGRAQKFFSVLTLFLRHGQASDAPTEKVDTGELDENNKPIKTNCRVGFDCVIKILKTKTHTSKAELSEIHIPYYFLTGFKQ